MMSATLLKYEVLMVIKCSEVLGDQLY